MPFPALRHALLVVLACLGWALAGEIPSGWETGLPFAQSFGPKDYHGGSQNWDIARDPQGLIYLANARGVLEFDGQHWRTITIGAGKPAYSLAVDATGRVFVGSAGELGYLAPDAQGRMGYVSLRDKVAPEDRGFSNLWRAHAAPDGVYFCGYDRLFRVRDGAVRAWKPTSAFRRSFLVGGRLYIRDSGQGLLRLEGDAIRPLPGGEVFRDVSVAGLFAGSGEDSILVTTLNRGTWMVENGRTVPITLPATGFLNAAQVTCGVSLPEGALALGTLQGNLVILDRRRNPRRLFGATAGLLREEIKNLVSTPEGHLWVVQARAVTRVQWPWPVSAFDTRNGLEGSVLCMARHEGALYVGTSQGVFVLKASVQPGLGEMPGFFHRIGGIDRQTWHLRSVGRELLAANHRGVYSIAGDSARLVVATPFATGFLLPARTNSARIFLGLENGLGIIHREGGVWKSEGLLAAIPGDVQGLREAPDGRIWAGTARNGLWRITLAAEGSRVRAEKVEPVGAEQGLTTGADIRFFTWSGQEGLLVSGKAYGISEERIHPWVELQEALGRDRRIQLAQADPNGGLWLEASDRSGAAFEEGVIHRSGSGAVVWKPLPRPMECAGAANALQIDADGTVWLGHYQGLSRIDPAGFPLSQEPVAMIRSVATLNGVLVFGGATSRSPRAEIPYERRGLRFQFAAPGFPEPSSVRFRVKMEGNDAEWSPWSTEAYRDFTNLPEGHYVFRVQAQDGQGRKSREAAFALRIRPPWFRTGWARAGLLIGLALTLYLVHRLRTRFLTQRNLELEEGIRRATQDLQIANRELQELSEQKNTFLGVVAHDLKSPLHGIVLAAESLERDGQERTRLKGSAIRREGEALCRLIDRFLNVAALESGELTARLEPIDFPPFVKAAVDRAAAKAAEKGTTVTADLSEGRLWVLGDHLYLREILDNLLSNAVKFSPRGARVEIRLQGVEGRCRISVTDQGPGLTESDRARLFKRFTRLSARPTAGEASSGLGLFIVKRMVDDLGGRIGVDSEPGHGATFWVELPGSIEPVAEPHAGGDEASGIS